MSEQLAFTFDAPNPTRPAPYTVTCADVLAWARTYSGKPFHCLLADPPYSLGDGKKGFMNAAWDTNIAFKPETWKVLAQHLLSGAFLMCFGGARTYHRLACALEDAGLIIHPALGFLQGQGFPKATGITDERFSGHRYGLQAMKPAIEFIALAQVPYSSKPFSSITQTGAGALNIDGGRISLPPGDKVHAGTVSTLGSGKADGWVRPWMNDLHTMNDKNAQAIARGNALGRWPPNFALSHTAQCVRVGERSVKGITGTACGVRATGGQSTAYGKFNGTGRYGEPTGYADATGHETVDEYRCADNCPVAKLDAQAGVCPSNAGRTKQRGQSVSYYGIASPQADGPSYPGDTGGPSRFFHVSDWSLDVAEQLAQADPVRYCAKASSSERSKGLDGMMKLRDDLTDEERAYVIRELKTAGVEF